MLAAIKESHRVMGLMSPIGRYIIPVIVGSDTTAKRKDIMDMDTTHTLITFVNFPPRKVTIGP